MVTFTDFKHIHDDLGYNTSDLGCVMLDFEPVSECPIPEEWLYTSPNSDHFWLKGWMGDNLHVTLLYGLLQPAYVWSDFVLELLASWEAAPGETQTLISFPSPYEDEKYVCIAAQLYLDEELEHANRRLSYLPHIDTFSPYLPHVTLAYVLPEYEQSAKLMLRRWVSDVKFLPDGLNLGSPGPKSEQTS